VKKISLKKRKRSFQLPEVQEGKKKKKKLIEFLYLFSFQYVATNIEGWLQNLYFLSVLAA
jgi:hypothetical protein